MKLNFVLFGLMLGITIASSGCSDSGSTQSTPGVGLLDDDNSQIVVSSGETDIAGNVTLTFKEGRQLDVGVREESTGAIVEDIGVYAIELSAGVFIWTDSANGQYQPTTKFVAAELGVEGRAIQVPAYILISVVGAGSAGMVAYEYTTSPPTFDVVFEDNAVIERCLTVDINDFVSLVSSLKVAKTAVMFVGVKTAPSNIRGVTAINNYGVVSGKWISDSAIEALTFTLSKKIEEADNSIQTPLCWIEIRDDPIPIIYASIPERITTQMAYFTEQFGDSGLPLWDTSIATSGNRFCVDTAGSNSGRWIESSAEQCFNMLDYSNHGSIVAGAGQATFSTGLDNNVAPTFRATNSYPYIWSGPPTRPSPFPEVGDFSVEFRMRFDQSSVFYGAGLYIHFNEDSTPTGTTYPYASVVDEEGVLQVWPGSNGVVNARMFGNTITINQPNEYHTYRLNYQEGSYSLFIDNVQQDIAFVGQSISSNLRPNAIMLGNPLIPNYAPGQWPVFTVDYIWVHRL